MNVVFVCQKQHKTTHLFIATMVNPAVFCWFYVVLFWFYLVLCCLHCCFMCDIVYTAGVYYAKVLY